MIYCDVAISAQTTITYLISACSRLDKLLSPLTSITLYASNPSPIPLNDYRHETHCRYTASGFLQLEGNMLGWCCYSYTTQVRHCDFRGLSQLPADTALQRQVTVMPTVTCFPFLLILSLPLSFSIPVYFLRGRHCGACQLVAVCVVGGQGR